MRSGLDPDACMREECAPKTAPILPRITIWLISGIMPHILGKWSLQKEAKPKSPVPQIRYEQLNGSNPHVSPYVLLSHLDAMEIMKTSWFSPHLFRVPLTNGQTGTSERGVEEWLQERENGLRRNKINYCYWSRTRLADVIAGSVKCLCF